MIDAETLTMLFNLTTFPSTRFMDCSVIIEIRHPICNHVAVYDTRADTLAVFHLTTIRARDLLGNDGSDEEPLILLDIGEPDSDESEMTLELVYNAQECANKIFKCAVASFYCNNANKICQVSSVSLEGAHFI